MKPKCKLIGKDGNAFSVIGKVSKTLKKNGLTEEAEKFVEEAFSAESYNKLICLCMDYVDVY